MADYKDYIVRYDIQADVTKAAEGLQSIANIAKQFEAPMKELRTSITQVSQAAFQLKQNSQITFAPKIDVGAFNNQLRNMVVQVRNAAAEMHAAIFEALSGNTAGTKVAQKGINSVLGGKKSIQDLKNDIQAYQKELDKILGTPKKNKKGETIRGRDGLLQMAKNANNTERIMQLESRKSMMQKLIKERTAELKLAEQLEKESAKTAKATEKSANATAKSLLPPTSKVQPAKLTNVTPAVIREWKKAFGDAKSKALTVNIRGNATGPNGALTIIEQIQSALAQLQAKSEFTIRPLLNSEAFTAAKIQLQELAALSAKVTAPFIAKDDKKVALKPGKGVATLSKAEKTSLAEAQQRVKLWKENIAKVQARLAANQAKVDPTPGIKGAITRDQNLLTKYQNNLAKDEQIVNGLQNKIPKAVQSGAKGLKPLAIDIIGNLTKINYAGKAAVTVPVVGELTKIQNKVTQSIPVNIKIMADQVQASLNSIAPRPVLYVDIKANTSSLPTQLKGATSAPTPAKGGTPVSVPKTVTSLPKLTAAEEQQLKDLTAKYGPLATAQARAEKAMNTAHEKLVSSGGTDKRFDNYRKAQQRFNTVNSQVQELNNQMRPLMVKQLQNAVGRELTGDELSQGLKAQGTINALSAKQRLTALQKTQLAEANNVINGLKTPSNVSQGGTAPVVPAKTVTPKTPKSSGQVAISGKVDTENIISQIKKIPRQTIPLYAKLMWEKGAIGKQDQLKKISKNIPAIKLNLDITGAVAKLEQFITMVKGANPQTIMLNASGTAPTSATKGGSRTIIGGGTNQGAIGGKGTTGHMSLSRNYPGYQYWTEQRASELMNMRKDARAAFANLTPYEKQQEQIQKQLAAKKAANSAMRNHNSMLPIDQNQKPLKMLTENRKYFEMAARKTGFNLVPGSMPFQNASYLQAVSDEMRAAGVRVPWGIQDQINKLNPTGPTAKGGSGGGGRSGGYRTAAPTSFYDRSRRWAYPFTGNTSFGARTPMAVDMAKGMGVMFAIGGAMSAIGSSFSQAMEYQNTMKTTEAILQNGTDTYSKHNFQNMERTVREVGVKTKFSAPEVASAARFLAMAGYDIDAINAAIRPIADLALIGDSDLGETADKMTNIMTTFQIAPERMREAANIMATTATRSNTDLMMLAESAKYGGGVANMYGRNDPNLFADTMALFGVMGNAGIQASSAGTALRMMYQNIFKPNKTQKAVLDMMDKTYGIKTVNADGSFRAMSQILVDMAQRIPENQMAQIVGNLFRITAQPGASAAILAAAGGDQNTANEIGAGIDAVSDKISSKAGLSSLVSLMLANRDSVSGNISGAIAEEKQNTIQGLWAQVTSTFTEGVVQAFEQRQGGFEGMLKSLREYLAKPETIQMLQNLLDMIIEIGKVMAQFVKIWADLYNAAPGLIKWWVTFQMIFTQIGTLISPVVALIGVFNRLRGIMLSLAGVSSTGSIAMARSTSALATSSGIASASSIATPLVVGNNRWGTKSITHATALRAKDTLNKNTSKLALRDTLYGASMFMPMPSASRPTRINPVGLRLDTERLASRRVEAEAMTAAHYAEVRARANRMYGWGRVGRGFTSAATAGLTMASYAPMFGGIKTMFFGLMTALTKAIGFLVNPITLAVAGLGTLGFSLYKLKQRIDGNTDAQIQARKQANIAADQTNRELAKEGQWYNDFLAQNLPNVEEVISSANVEQIKAYDDRQQRFKELYATLFTDLGKNASNQSIDDVASKWRQGINDNWAHRLAFGDQYDNLVGQGLTQWQDVSKAYDNQVFNAHSATSYVVGEMNAAQRHARELQMRQVQGALMIEGANSQVAQQAVKDITELRRKYLNGEIKTQEEFEKQANEIKNRAVNLNANWLSADGMTAQQFQNLTDRSLYLPYQQGIANLLESTIQGQMGTMTGKMNAYRDLIEKKIQPFQEGWIEAIGHVIGDYRMVYNAISDDGKQAAKVEIMLTTMPNGQIDYTALVNQIREKVNNFNLSLQTFSDMIATVYGMMAKAGIVDGEDKSSWVKYVQTQTQHQTIDARTASQYWKEYIASNPASEWIKAGITEKQYVDWVTSKQGEYGNTIKVGNKVVDAAKERTTMRRNLGRTSANSAFTQYQGVVEQAKAYSQNTNPTNSENPSSPTPTNVNPPSQEDYASNYERNAAKPTQVNINIGNLANFDRTMIAANADERDLMANMESKIAEAVYRIFAEASNQAQLAFNA